MRGRGCKRHCVIWYGGEMRQVTMGCAHCPYVSKKLDLSQTYDQELVERQIQSSRDGHERICDRPIYGSGY